MGMKEWYARGEHARHLLNDLRALQNRRHFGSTIVCTACAKQRFLQTKSIIVYFNIVFSAARMKKHMISFL
jgi:hypothetical protein